MTQLSLGSGLKGAADPANRAEINEMVLKLEPMNPTELATSSPLLNGVWELLYTGGYGMGFLTVRRERLRWRSTPAAFALASLPT